ncbi:MAG TPA: hypothetical protein VGA99_04295 [bacterium]
MKCDFSKEKLLDYFYAEVTSDEKSEVETHVAGCSLCQTELAQLQQTSVVLGRWSDEDPGLNLKFVQQKSSWWTWLAPLQGRSWPKFALGFSMGLAAVLVILSLMNFEANYADGSLHVKFSLFDRTGPNSSPPLEALDQPITQREFDAWKQAAYELMQTMIDNAATQQRYEQRLLLTQVARDLDLKRQQDLQRVGQGLEVFQLVNENKFRRTNEVLQQLIYAAQVQTTDTNRIENK